jgi:hypothetical protein
MDRPRDAGASPRGAVAALEEEIRAAILDVLELLERAGGRGDGGARRADPAVPPPEGDGAAAR